jgi:hypothetical protein
MIACYQAGQLRCHSASIEGLGLWVARRSLGPARGQAATAARHRSSKVVTLARGGHAEPR